MKKDELAGRKVGGEYRQSSLPQSARLNSMWDTQARRVAVEPEKEHLFMYLHL